VEWILIGLALLVLGGRRGSPQPTPGVQVPLGYGQAPSQMGAMLNAGGYGGIGLGLNSSALNGFSRPLPGGWGVPAGPLPSDPVYGDVGMGQADLGAYGGDPNQVGIGGDISGVIGPGPDYGF